MRVLRAAALLALAAALAPSSGRAASFDCAKASAADERAVCADPRLSALDDLLNDGYRQAKGQASPDEAPRLLTIARGILADRGSCRGNRACLLAVYAGGIESYRVLGASVRLPEWVNAVDMAAGTAPETGRLPTRLAACVATRVTGIGPRLEGDRDFSSGTGVSFANGGTQVSYEREAAVIASKPGDPVVLCLTAIPRACPPGDERGRWYVATNLRTRRSWSLPDSQHSCGGA